MIPAPGHPDAVRDGCTCPRGNNAHGAGSGYRDESGAPVFWYDRGCPLHGGAEPVPYCERLTCTTHAQEGRPTGDEL
jgi:hypothetical protein